VKNDDGAVALARRRAQGEGVDLEVARLFGAFEGELVADDFGRLVELGGDGGDAVVARGFEDAQAGGRGGEAEYLAGGAVGQADGAAGLGDDHALDHAVEERDGALDLHAQLGGVLGAQRFQLVPVPGGGGAVAQKFAQPRGGGDNQQSQ